MWKKWSLLDRLSAIVFCASLFAFSIAAAYLVQITGQSQAVEVQRLQTEIAKNLAVQLSSYLAAKDDLSAISALKSARTHYPQLQELQLFDRQGKVVMHSDPAMLGKQVPAPQGLRSLAPEVDEVRRQGRWFTRILVPLPENEDLYLRAFFDQSRERQRSAGVWLRFAVLILLVSLLPALLVRRGLRSALPVPADLNGPVPSSGVANRSTQWLELALAEMRSATLAISGHNLVLAANTLALELLNCRAEELVGAHILRAPLPAPLLDLFQQALHTPGRPTEGKLVLTPRSSAIPVRIVFAPADDHFELAFITLG